MKILALEKEIESSEEKYRPHLKKEALKVWELQQAGFISEIYYTKEVHTAVMILECKDSGEANVILESLPLVKEGLIAFDIKPLVPYDGFKRLLEMNET